MQAKYHQMPVLLRPDNCGLLITYKGTLLGVEVSTAAEVKAGAWNSDLGQRMVRLLKALGHLIVFSNPSHHEGVSVCYKHLGITSDEAESVIEALADWGRPELQQHKALAFGF